jgi:serine/threonine protein phosphatase PrpC
MPDEKIVVIHKPTLETLNVSGNPVAVYQHAGVPRFGKPPKYSVNHDTFLAGEAGPLADNALHDAFVLADNDLHGIRDIRTSSEHHLRTLQNGPDLNKSGTTAVIANINGDTIQVANLGDCRASLVIRRPENPILNKVPLLRAFEIANRRLGTRVETHSLTTDQNASYPDEATRAQALGATITNDTFIHLVEGPDGNNRIEKIMLSGTLGNHDFETPWMRRKPVITTINLRDLNLTPETEVFLILESDGSHRNRKKPSRDADFERAILVNTNDLSAKKLAMTLGEDATSGTDDNITVMVTKIDLGSKQRSIFGVLDGNGPEGIKISHHVRDLFREHLLTPDLSLTARPSQDQLHSPRPAVENG